MIFKEIQECLRRCVSEQDSHCLAPMSKKDELLKVEERDGDKRAVEESNLKKKASREKKEEEASHSFKLQ